VRPVAIRPVGVRVAVTTATTLWPTRSPTRPDKVEGDLVRLVGRHPTGGER
jgi:hypothetical protein